jgi:hypothetical protein
MKASIKTQQEQFLINHWPAVVFLLHYGAGTLFSGCPGSETIVELVKAELEDGESLAGPGDWTYEIAKMVEHQDIEKILSTIEDIAKQLKLSK